MNAIVLITLLLAVSIYARLPLPCDRCVGLGAPCGPDAIGDACLGPFVCRQMPTTGTFACVTYVAPGESCDEELNNCPPDYGCSNGTCEVANAWAGVDDPCNDDDECTGLLECSGGKCELGGLGACSSNSDCDVIDEYCALTCMERKDNGETCLSDDECKFESLCHAGECVAEYSAGENKACSSTAHCEAGLVCKFNYDKLERRCVEPEVHFMFDKYSALWTGCEATDFQGCACNTGSKAVERLVEKSVVHHPECVVRRDNFLTCMRDNGCKSFGLGGENCIRENCRAQFIAGTFCPTLNPTLRTPTATLFCGAMTNSFLLLAGIVVALIL